MKVVILKETKDEHGTMQVSVSDEAISKLLQINDAEIKDTLDITTATKSIANIPITSTLKRAKLKKFGYTDQDIDIIDQAGAL